MYFDYHIRAELIFERYFSSEAAFREYFTSLVWNVAKNNHCLSHVFHRFVEVSELNSEDLIRELRVIDIFQPHLSLQYCDVFNKQTQEIHHTVSNVFSHDWIAISIFRNESRSNGVKRPWFGDDKPHAMFSFISDTSFEMSFSHISDITKREINRCELRSKW